MLTNGQKIFDSMLSGLHIKALLREHSSKVAIIATHQSWPGHVHDRLEKTIDVYNIPNAAEAEHQQLFFVSPAVMDKDKAYLCQSPGAGHH